MQIHLSQICENSFKTFLSTQRTTFQSRTETTCIVHAGERGGEQLISIDTVRSECKGTLGTCDNR